MAGKKRGPEDSSGKKSSRRKVGAKKMDKKVIAAKVGDDQKTIPKKSQPRPAKTAAKGVATPKISNRKPVPIKTARVGKRAVLPPLPPPPAPPLKTTRSPARVSRAKASARSKGLRKTGHAVCEFGTCSEAALREKLRLAAPYIKIWMTRRATGNNAADTSSPEAAFVRIWQWLNLETALDNGRIVTPDLIDSLLAEEHGEAEL